VDKQSTTCTFTSWADDLFLGHQANNLEIGANSCQAADNKGPQLQRFVK